MNKPNYSQDFIEKLRNAYQSLTECRIHEQAGPGYKGLQENFWQLTEFETEAEFFDTVFPREENKNDQG